MKVVLYDFIRVCNHDGRFQSVPNTTNNKLCVPDFDRRVNDNKTAAEDALLKIPAINATILAAVEKTKQAEAALGNAAADAREAKSKAEEAERIASNVQKVREPLTSRRAV